MLLLALALACSPDEKDDTASETGDSSDSGDSGETGETGETGDSGDTTAPTGDSLEDALPVTLSAGDTVEVDDAVEAAGDHDFYAVDLDEGASLFVMVVGAAEGEPDTVVQVWGPDGTLFVINDDLPYRISGTDSGLWMRAPEAGRYTVEVVEYNEWAGARPQGDPDWTYTLSLGLDLPYGETWEDVDSDNDTLDAEAARAVSNVDPWYGDPWSDTVGASPPYAFVAGAIGVAGDEDWYAGHVAGPAFIEVSSFPGVPSAWAPRLELYDEDGEVLATTTDTTVEPIIAPVLGYDVGLRVFLPDVASVFVRVVDEDGGGGADHAYALLATVVWLNEDAVPTHAATGDGDERTVYDDLDVQVGDPDYVLPNGVFEAGEAFQSWRIDDRAAAGRYLSFQLETQASGSTLDASVALLDASGAVVASAAVDPTGTFPDEPAILDVELPSDGPFWLVVYNDASASGVSARYFGWLTIADAPSSG